MPDKADPAAGKPHKLAGSARLARFQSRIDSGRTIRFRFTPFVLLAFAVAGLWVQIARAPGLGYIIVMLVWIASGAIQSFGPLGNLHGGRPDEREAVLVRSGHAAGHFAAMVVAVVGCLAFGIAGTAKLAGLGSVWAPASNSDWFALAFFLLAVENNVATMAASAKQPKNLDEDEA